MWLLRTSHNFYGNILICLVGKIVLELWKSFIKFIINIFLDKKYFSHWDKSGISLWCEKWNKNPNVWQGGDENNFFFFSPVLAVLDFVRGRIMHAFFFFLHNSASGNKFKIMFILIFFIYKKLHSGIIWNYFFFIKLRGVRSRQLF